MGGANKLLELLEGKPLVEHVVAAALEAGAHPVVVVTGHQAEAVCGALSAHAVELVDNPRWPDGMGTSVAAGIGALEGRVRGALICPGDMPRVGATDLAALMKAFAADVRVAAEASSPPAAAFVPHHEGRRGNPVLWSASWFSALTKLARDQGARALLDDPAVRVVHVPAGPGVLVDTDTPDALEALRRSRTGSHDAAPAAPEQEADHA
jgi:molybdenum cofactor cytidylyltransferase